MAKVKIPKRVAGVKVPKKVRKQAKKALKAADNPMVRQFAAAALGAAAQARTARTARTARAEAGSGDEGRSEPSRTIVGVDGERLVEAVRDAAIDGLRRFIQGFEEGLRNAAARVDESGEEAVRRGDASGPDEDEDEDAARPSGRTRPGASAPIAEPDA